jgi:hypothetical protein
MKKSAVLFVMLSLLLSVLAACQAVTPSDDGLQENAVSQPDESPTATTAAPGLYSLGSIAFAQSGKAPDYTLNVETPVMNGSSNPRVVAFNKAVAQVVQKEVDAFKKSLEDMPAAPISAGSYFAIHHVLVSPPGNLFSLQFKVETYSDGAAHPYDYTLAFNYDLEQGRAVELAELFKPGADYLQALSEYCADGLNKKTELAPVLFTEGLSPTPENYRNWNITAEGLMVTFNAYQVTPYAAGPQVVVIPYAVLKDIIDPQGPLGDFVK